MLTTVLESYFVQKRITAESQYLKLWTVEKLSDYLGRPATVADLEDVSISAWLAAMELKHAQSTVHSFRAGILAIWKFAVKKKLCLPPEDVRRCPSPDPLPVAWQLDEVNRLLWACGEMTGKTCGVPAGDKMRAIVLAAYDTGLRRGDLWRIHRDQVRPDGTVMLKQHKTGRRHFPRMRRSTVKAVLALPGDYPLRWCGGGSSGSFYREWRKLRKLAGLSGTGALHKLRKTGATHVAKQHGMDAARRFLGHRTPTMVRHYVDESIALQESYLPPELNNQVQTPELNNQEPNQ